MANIAGFVLDVGAASYFFRSIGIHDFASFVVDSDGFNIRLAGGVVDDISNVLGSIGEHGVVGAEADGVRELGRSAQDMLHVVVLLVADVQKGPHSHACQKHEPGGEHDFGEKAVFETPEHVRLRSGQLLQVVMIVVCFYRADEGALVIIWGQGYSHANLFVINN